MMFSKIPLNYASRAFDGVLGGLMFSIAGGAGLYSIHSWLHKVNFNMNNVSHYTFSGRTSCMMREIGDFSRIEGECMQKNVSFSENLTDLESDCTTDENDETIARGGAGSALLFLNLLPNEGEETHQQEGREEACCAEDTSSSLLDILPCMSADASSASSSLSSYTEQEQEQDGDSVFSTYNSTTSMMATSNSNTFDFGRQDETMFLHQQLKQYLQQYLLSDNL